MSNPVAHHAILHKDDHKSGGGDAFTINDLLDAIARIIVRKNTGVDVGKRRRLNLVEGSNVTLTIADDPTNEEVDITVAAAGGVPTGLICMWHGLLANIPAGWLLCDGANGTPDLRARFVRGAPAGVNPGGTGGADSHSHTNPDTLSAGAHQHTIPFAITSGRVETKGSPPWGTGSSFSRDYDMGFYSQIAISRAGMKSESAGAHTHGQGSTGSSDSRPPFYEVAFIMKS